MVEVKKTVSARRKLWICVLILAAFVVGILAAEVNTFINSMSSPRVQSDHKLASRIRGLIGGVPDSACRLYWSSHHFTDADRFFAFSAPKEDMETFINGLGLSDFKMIDSKDALPTRIISRGPTSWNSKYEDKNWDPLSYNSWLVAEESRMTVIYLADVHRVFVCLWGSEKPTIKVQTPQE